MRTGLEDFNKIRTIFRSPAAIQVFRWSKCIHGKMLWICILNIIYVLCSLIITLITKGLIDAAVSIHKDSLWKYGLILVLAVLIEIVLGFVLSLIHTRASAKLQHNLQGMIIREILTKEYASLKRYHSGEMVNRVFSDVNVIKSGVLSIIPGIISTMVSFIGAAAILIALDWRFVLLLSLAGLIGIVIVLMFRKPMKERHKRVQQAGDRLHASVQETFENIRLIKASVSEKRVFNQINNRQEMLEKEQIRQGKFSALMNNSMGTMFRFSWLFCMLWGSAAIHRGEMTYGSLVAMIQLIGRVQGPIASAVNIATEVYGVVASAERLMQMTDLPCETTGEPMQSFDEIRIEHVSFRYEDGTDDVLHNINYVIRKGDFVALTGLSGGGKSSLFQLLLGIYLPTEGRITFRYNNISREVCRETRSLFAYVPQGNTLFSGTLRENLTLFTTDATDNEIWEAVEIACIDDLVNEIGLDAELGERGLRISEGQAQRVAVARALLAKAPILLLDEVTSALDEETETKMVKNLSNLRDKTCLIVTHRRAPLAVCDYRLHISEGRMEKRNILMEDEEDSCTFIGSQS